MNKYASSLGIFPLFRRSEQKESLTVHFIRGFDGRDGSVRQPSGRAGESDMYNHAEYSQDVNISCINPSLGGKALSVLKPCLF